MRFKVVSELVQLWSFFSLLQSGLCYSFDLCTSRYEAILNKSLITNNSNCIKSADKISIAVASRVL